MEIFNNKKSLKIYKDFLTNPYRIVWSFQKKIRNFSAYVLLSLQRSKNDNEVIIEKFLKICFSRGEKYIPPPKSEPRIWGVGGQ